MTEWRPAATLATLRARADLLAAIRAFMNDAGVMEVDTGVLASAPPSERGLESFAVAGAGYLVPSPEHALKRLLAAGAGAIFQLGHVFRAGESGRWHNPEFCMLEWYRPGATMADLMDETERLIGRIAQVACVPRRRYRDLFQAHAGIDPLESTAAQLASCARDHDVAPGAVGTDDKDPDSRAFWLDLIMSLVVQPRLGLDGPECVTGFPADDAVLVAPDPEDDRLSQRFECYWQGVELANGAQELTDVVLAGERMRRECAAIAQSGGPPRAPDERLLAAMHAGLPACAGVALGVDRLLALMRGCDGLAPVLAFDWARR
ncbi:EF-P lysine aminoacylase EpmA [Salinisphaera aquimarina]|uniref:EF-P lysine aminoacylase EpmA n=1 Tax=Salinisphaera aquimarina TaxID=2094031 RepID=A0ABV7EWC1_9GAMM